MVVRIITLLTILFTSQVMSSESDHETLKEQCTSGSWGFGPYAKSESCHRAGELYYQGGTEWEKSRYGDISPPKSYSRALFFFKESCKQRPALSQSCYKVSEMYEKGEGVGRDMKSAFEYARKSCNLLNGHEKSKGSGGCVALGRMYTNGEGVEVNNHKAARSYLNDCKFNENATSCKQALMAGSYACNSGNVDSCFLVSDMYKELQPRYFDKASIGNAPEKSNDYLIKACEFNSSRGCLGVALNYMSEEGVKQDYAMMIKYASKACEGSPSYMCGGLSMFYADENIVKKDPKMVIKYATIGCDKRDAKSCAILGVQYANGDGVKQDYQAALKYFKQGCEYELAGSCRFVMNMYIKGEGASVDRSLALEYGIKACKAEGQYRDQDCETMTDKHLPEFN